MWDNISFPQGDQVREKKKNSTTDYTDFRLNLGCVFIILNAEDMKSV